ncbi:MAG: hypothetical protein R2712_03110 [Vicinamibacterales bacterium]
MQVLADAHPQDAAVREELAKGLLNATAHAGADSARADGLLARLQASADAHPQDATVREHLAKGLLNAIHYAGADSARADGLLARSQALADAHPQDAAVREELAKGYSTPPPSRARTALPTGYWHACRRWPTPTHGTPRFARTWRRGCSTPSTTWARTAHAPTGWHACRRGPTPTRKTPRFAKNWPSCSTPSKTWARTVHVTGWHACRRWPTPTRWSPRFAKNWPTGCSISAIRYVGADSARADGPLAHLQALADAHPQDAAVREHLAKALLNAIHCVGADTARVDGPLAHLQALADVHPQDAAVARLAWMGCLAAFALSLNSGPLRPQPLHAMAGFPSQGATTSASKHPSRYRCSHRLDQAGPGRRSLTKELDAAVGVRRWRVRRPSAPIASNGRVPIWLTD